MSFTLREAERSNSIPLIGMYGKSGSGKTFSALLLARGLVGPTGRIGMIDTERGRGSLYADQIPGGYEVGELDRFAPADYITAIDAIEESGVDILVIDSASHEWEGEGGVRDQAAQSEERTGRAGLHNWIKPKAQHTKFVQRLLRTRIPVIVCLRGKQMTKQLKIKGKTEVIKDDFTTPIQDGDFIFEMTAHMEILADHTIKLTKHSHPDLEPCFPNGGLITIETGAKIAQWAKGGAKKTATPEEEAAVDLALLQTAQAHAELGTVALKEWWVGEGKPHQKILANRLEGLKATASAVDAEEDNATTMQSLLAEITKLESPAQGTALMAREADFVSALPDTKRQKIFDALDDVRYTVDDEIGWQ